MKTKYKIIVTDDNPDNLELIEQVLGDEFDIIKSTCGKTCLKLAHSEKPDLILLDVMMPEMDGYEVLAIKQADEAIANIPVIFLTAKYRDADRVTKVLSLGAIDYITKPFDDDVLQARVRMAIKFKLSEDEKREKNIELEKRLSELTTLSDSLQNKTNKLEACSTSVQQVTNFIEQYKIDGNASSLKRDSLEKESQELVDTFLSLMENHKVSEANLVQSDARLKLHRKQTFMGIIEWDNNFNIITWNKAAERIFGYSHEDSEGKNLLDLVFNDKEKSNFKTIKNQLFKTKKYVQSQSTNVSKGGEEIFCEWNNTPIILADDKTPRVISLINDITERQKANNEIEKQRGELELILNNMVDAVISINDKGEILSFNKAAEDLFQYKAKDILGERVNMLMPDPFRNEHETYIQNYIETGVSKIVGRSRDLTAIKANGDTFPLKLKITNLPSANNGERRFMASCHDLTIEKEFEVEIRRNQTVEALGKLTSGIAHDYNNLLGIILGYSNMLQGLSVEDEKIQEYAQEITRAGERGKALTGKLLSFTNKEQLRPSVININDVITIDKNMLEVSLTARINLKTVLAKDLGLVYVDKSEISDMLLNISINAMHAIDGDGELSIVTDNIHVSQREGTRFNLVEGNYTQITITDNGSGMDEETLSHIFNPFFTTKGKDGTGLGLSQVYGAMKRCGGTIKVNSELGKGTTFNLLFPTYDKKEVKPTAKIETNGKAVSSMTCESGEENILIVDDNESILRMNKEILEMQGYAIQTTTCAKEALEIIKSKNIDLVISDVTMPTMNGFDLARHIRTVKPAMKILLVSGYADHTYNTEGVEDLYKTILAKPFDITDLTKRVKELIVVE